MLSKSWLAQLVLFSPSSYFLSVFFLPRLGEILNKTSLLLEVDSSFAFAKEPEGEICFPISSFKTLNLNKFIASLLLI